MTISTYEVYLDLFYDEKQKLHDWARDLIVVNTLLSVINSSINFSFYCGDVVFRECLSELKSRFCCCKETSLKNAEDVVVELQSIEYLEKYIDVLMQI